MQPRNPYVGPRTFQRDEGYLFFGREREARDLIALVSTERLVIFYAQSGAGKSSIVNTRLIPALEGQGYEVLPVGRVSGDAGAGMDVDNVYVYNLIRSLEQHETEPAILTKRSLPEFLAHLNFDESGFFYDPSPVASIPEEDLLNLGRRALIIDQFEELFSTYPESWEKRDDFFRQLAQAMQDDPLLWVVLIMREDFIAALDPYSHLISNGLRARYYMQRLERDAALQAVKSPVQEIRPYAPGVAEKLVDDLGSITVQKPDGKLDIQPGQYIEPVQLQVVCYGLWDHLPLEGNEITEKDLEDVGDVDQSLGSYYDRRVSEVARAKNARERLIREWFEKKLIAPGGIRNMVLQEREQKPGELDDEVIRALQSDLVRAEKHGGATWYELTHDRLVEPILESNKVWFNENLSPLQRQAALWKDQDQNESWLLGDEALEEVEAWAGEHEDELTGIEKDFLKVCRSKQAERWQQQEREAEHREREVERQELEYTKRLADEEARSARYARRFSIVAGILTVIAVIASFFAVRQTLDAMKQTNIAQTEQVRAQDAEEKAKGEAAAALSGQLSAYAVNLLNSQPDLAVLLSLQADRIDSNLASRNALLTVQQETAQVRSFLNIEPIPDEVQFSQDGKILAFRNTDGITLWDANSLKPLTTSINEHFRSVTFVALSKDGKLFASASCTEPGESGCKKSAIVLWDAQAGKPIGEELTGHRSYVYSVTFSPDAKVLASGSIDNTINLWDISDPFDPYLIRVLTEHTSPVESIAFSPDGNILASASDDQTVRLWDGHTGQPIGEPLTGHENTVNFLTFSPNGKILASGGGDGRIILWDVAKGESIGEPLQQHSLTVWYMAFSPDGKTLASGSDDGSVILWDVTKREPRGEPLNVDKGTVWSVAFSPDGKMLASSHGAEGQIILWDVANHKPFGKPLTQHKKAVYSLTFDPKGEKLISGSLDSTIVYWDITKPTNPKVHKELKGHLGRVNSMQFITTDGRLLASTGDDGTILIDTKSGTSLGKVNLIDTNANDKIVAYQLTDPENDQNIIHIQDGSTGMEISAPIVGDNPLFSPDGKLLLYQTGEHHLWDVSQKKERQLPADISNPTFSPDSRILIYYDSEGGINLWDIATAEKIGQPVLGSFRAMSPDLSVLVYEQANPETGEPNIHQWSIVEGKQIAEDTAMAFLGSSRNGKVLAFRTVDGDSVGSINLLDLSKGVITTDLLEKGDFLTLNEDGRILFYQTSDDQNAYVHALDTETRTSIGQPITGNLASKGDSGYAIWEVGSILAYETEVSDEVAQRAKSSISFINTSTLAPIGEAVPDGSYLGESSAGEILAYETIENKQPQINLLNTSTGLLAGEGIQGDFLGISRDGKTVVLRNEGDSIVLWDTTQTWPLGTPVAEAPEKVTSAALSLDGQTLAWIGEAGITISTATGVGEPFNNHFGSVTSVDFLPDAKTLLARGEDGYLVVWDYIRRESRGEDFSLGTNVNVQMANGGKILVVNDRENNTITLLDLATGQQIGDVISGSTAVLSPDGATLAVGNDKNNTTTLWDLSAFQPRSKAISGVYIKFSANSQLIAIGDYEKNRTTFWSLDSSEEIGAGISGYYGTFSLDGQTFANYDRDKNTTTLWKLPGTPLGQPFPGFGIVSPNGKFLVMSSHDEDGRNVAQLWEFSNPTNPEKLDTVRIQGEFSDFQMTGNLLVVHRFDSAEAKNFVDIYYLTDSGLKRINQRLLPASDFALSPNLALHRVAYVEGKRVVIWDQNLESRPSPLEIYPGVISGMTFNQDGSILAVYGNSGIVLWDVKAKTALGEPLPGPAIPGTAIAISSNGKILASQASDGIVLTDLVTQNDIRLEAGEYAGQLTGNMSFYANGTRFATIGDEGTMLTWDVSGGEPEILDDQRQLLKGKSSTLSGFSPDGRYLAYDSYGRIAIWDMQKKQSYLKAGEFPGTENSMGALTFSSNGMLLAYTDGPKILLWNILQKEKLGELLTESNNITRLSLIMANDEPQYLVSADDSGTTQIWDWATRTKVGAPMPGNLKIMGFNDDSHIVYYLDPSGRLITWQWGMTRDAWNELLCPQVRRNFTQEEWKLYFPVDMSYPTKPEEATCPQWPLESAPLGTSIP